MDCCSKPVGRAVNAAPTTIQNVGINHGRAHILVPQKLLHGSDIIAVLQQTGSKRMAKCVRTGWLRDTSLKPRVLDGFLEDRLVEVVSLLDPRARVHARL